MTIKIAFTCLFTCVISLSTAQQLKTTELKPIYHQGGRYYYNLKKVDGGAYGLQIPLQSLNDAEVNRRYRNFKRIRSIEAVVSFVPAVYLVTNLPSTRSRRVNTTSFYTVMGASILAIIGIELCAKHQLKKGIDRYNELVITPSSGSLGASLTYTF